jgi:acetyl-CoA acetyltransferase
MIWVFVPRGEAWAVIAERDAAPGGEPPLNTDGGGLSYMHSGTCGMYALRESVRQMRGTARMIRQHHDARRCRRHFRRR